MEEKHYTGPKCSHLPKFRRFGQGTFYSKGMEKPKWKPGLLYIFISVIQPYLETSEKQLPLLSLPHSPALISLFSSSYTLHIHTTHTPPWKLKKQNKTAINHLKVPSSFTAVSYLSYLIISFQSLSSLTSDELVVNSKNKGLCFQDRGAHHRKAIIAVAHLFFHFDEGQVLTTHLLQDGWLAPPST